MRLSMLFLSLLFIASSSAVEVINKGNPGDATADLLARIDRDVIALKPNLVILMVGGNDLLNTAKMVSYDVVRKNLTALIDQLTAHSKVLLVSPPPTNQRYLFMRHDPNRFSCSPNVKLSLLSEIIRSKSIDRPNVWFVDLFSFFRAKHLPCHYPDAYFINEMNSGIADGTHPTAYGYQVIAQQVGEFIKQNIPLERDAVVVCIGGSFTYGSFMEGAGTATGDTYPSVLSRLLNP